MNLQQGYLPQAHMAVRVGGLGQVSMQQQEAYQAQYQHQPQHQCHLQTQVLPAPRLQHPLDPPLPGLRIFPPVADLSQQQQQQNQHRIYPPQAPPPQLHQGGDGTGHRRTSSWPQRIELHMLPPQTRKSRMHGNGWSQHTRNGYNSSPIGGSGEMERFQQPTNRLPPSHLNMAAYGSAVPGQDSTLGQYMGNYPMQGISHQAGYVGQGESWRAPIGMPASVAKPGWTPNHMRCQSDGMYSLDGDRYFEEPHGPSASCQLRQNGELQRAPGFGMSMQWAQHGNRTVALQSHLATMGPAPSVPPEHARIRPEEWNTNHASPVTQISNKMSHRTTTHANPPIQSSNGMSAEEHVYKSTQPTPPVSPRPIAAPRDRTYEDPLLMLLKAAELILGPLIPKGMSMIAKEAGGEKLTARQKMLPLPVCFNPLFAMRTRDHPNEQAGNRLSLHGLWNPRRNTKVQRLPPLAEALRNVNLNDADSDTSPKDSKQTEALNPETLRQLSSESRESNMLSSDISQSPIFKKRKLENCSCQTPCQVPGLEGVRQQYEKPFNIFEEILKRPDLTLLLAKHLRVQELLILYRISRDFHNVVNTRFTTVIQAQASARAPESAKIFPPRCYAKLCIPDPGLRPHPVARRAAVGETRKVPSFRWLLMVCFREMVCHEIITILAEDGVPVPDRCAETMKKIWLLMDIPDNARRIGLAQNCEIFTDVDLFFATLFFVKLDMRFTDPITGSGKDGMRRLLLAQPSLSMLWRTLKRTALISKLDVMRLFVRWKYQPRQDQRGLSIFGIPAHEVGIVQYQGWGRTRNRTLLQRPDELLLKESIRRGLELQQRYTDMFLWGYINPNTMQDYPPVLRRRQMERMEGLEEMLVPVEDRGKVEVGKVVSRRVMG
ncbi:predicted protein [Histoplasma mississippiense (nom. inval.)]|nr:predicted protein [Histoplasma mississippiense (nom. inval.)]EDN02624.1 predicted protein [Histoplasma mississippiense (nom. inval.)]